MFRIVFSSIPKNSFTFSLKISKIISHTFMGKTRFIITLKFIISVTLKSFGSVTLSFIFLSFKVDVIDI